MPCSIYDLIMRHKLRVYSHRGGDRGGGKGNSHNIPDCDKAEYEAHDCTLTLKVLECVLQLV